MNRGLYQLSYAAISCVFRASRNSFVIIPNRMLFVKKNLIFFGNNISEVFL